MTLYSGQLHDFVAESVPVETPVQRRSHRRNLYRSIGKRTIDLGLVLMVVPIVVPVILLMALLLMRDGANPFYLQDRIGRAGRVFRIWKLRTMVPDAEARLGEHLASDPVACAEWTSTQKLKDDPRITRLGRVLRKSSMDELPQLWNVVKGDMSLVGPRPMMVNQRGLYAGRSYFTLRPGVTGFWQVSDRNACDFSDRVGFDEAYDRAVSLKTDVKVLARTVAVVFRATGY